MSLVSSLVALYFYLQYQATADTLAPIYAASRFLPVALYFYVPRIAKRIGDTRFLVTTRLVTGVAIADFAFAPNFQIAAAFFVIYRFLFEFAMPIRQTFATEIVEPHQTGTIISVSNSVRRVAQFIAPSAACYLFEASYFFTFPFFLGSAVLALNSVEYHAFYKDKESLNKKLR